LPVALGPPPVGDGPASSKRMIAGSASRRPSVGSGAQVLPAAPSVATIVARVTAIPARRQPMTCPAS